MKSYKAYITEKFSDTSDPIKDMGIGLGDEIKKYIADLGKRESHNWKFNYKPLPEDEYIVWCAEQHRLHYVQWLLAAHKYNDNSILHTILMGCMYNYEDIIEAIVEDEDAHIPNMDSIISEGKKLEPEFKKVLKTNNHILGHINSLYVDAAMFGSFPLIKFCVEVLNVDVNVLKGEGLSRSASAGYYDIAKYLCERGCDPTLWDNRAIIWSAEHEGHGKILKLLVKYGADVHAGKDEVIRKAVQTRDKEMVSFLLSKGCDINGGDGRTLINACNWNPTLDWIKYLIDNGADIHLQNDEALIEASRKKKSEVIKYLIEKGAKINAQNGFVLRKAVITDNAKLVEFLVNKGANIYSEIMDLAIKRGKESIIKLLHSKVGKKKLVKESIVQEGYGSGFSFTGGAIKGMGSTTRGGFGGSNNLGGPNMMYTYEIKPLNHTLEQKPQADTSIDMASVTPDIQLGSKIKGRPIRSNATPNKQYVVGIIYDIVKTDDSAIKYYVVRNEDNQLLTKIDPLTAELIMHDPVEYYFDATDASPSRRHQKIEKFRKDGVVRESITEE